jgi:putative ABC transport system permease protein
MQLLRAFSGVPRENVLMALSNLRANKFRSFLTVLGIVIGVMTVIVIASILTGLRQNIINLIEDYGTNNIYAFHLTTGFQFGPRDRKEMTRKPLTPENGQAILRQAESVEDVGWQSFLWMFEHTMTYAGETYKRGNLQGVSANYGTISNAVMSEGRFISETDDLHRRNVMVIGSNVREALFRNRSQVVGSEVLMGGRSYELVGVVAKRKGSFFGENEEDNNVYIPYRTGLKITPRQEFLLLTIRAKEGQRQQALEQVESILRRQRGVKFNEPNNFDLTTSDKFIQQFDSITASVGLIAIAISGVGLLVGGIGVMNIMLVSVTERTREIGIRKAVGAKRKDIVTQFLFEAMTLTFLGGILGIVLSIGISFLLVYLLPSLPATIPLWAVVTGMGVSIAVGLTFGVWPARVASRLDPIECLRYE